MKRIIALILIFNVFFSLYGQGSYKFVSELQNTIKHHPDSLELLNNVGNNTPQYYFLEGYRQKCLGQYAEAHLLLNKATELTNKKNILLAKVYHEISLIHHYQSKDDSAIVYAQKEIMVEDLNDTIINKGYALGNVAVFYKFKNKIDSALKYNKLALTTFRETQDSTGIARIENNLGSLYKEIDIGTSIKHFTNALEIYAALNKPYYKSYVEHNLGLLYMDNGQLDKALKFLKISNKYKFKDSYFYSINTGNMGFIYLNMKEYNKAEKYLKESIKSNHEINNTKAHSFLNLGALYTETKQYDKAEKYIYKAKEVAEKINYVTFYKTIYKALTELYALSHQTRNFKDAFKEYCMFVDSFHVNQYQEKLAEFSQQFEVEKTRRELQLIQKDKQIQKEEMLKQEARIKFQNTQLISGSVILTLTIFLLIAFMVLSQKKKTLAKVIEKQRENVLKQNEQLEIAVLERTKELEKAMEKVKESDKLKSSFLANLSHEVRTPLNSIMGFSDLIAEGDCSREALHQYSSMIRNNGFNLLNIVNDLIDVSRIESNMFDINPSSNSYKDLIENIESENEDKARFFKKEDSVVLKWKFVESSKNILCDLPRVLIVFDKLINNAFQYTRKGFVEVGSEIKGSKITFYIKDTGIGIEEEYINQIFENFRKIDKQDVINRGLGVGLYVSKYIVEKMNSELKIESVKNQGTKLSFSCELIDV